MALQTSLSRSP